MPLGTVQATFAVSSAGTSVTPDTQGAGRVVRGTADAHFRPD
jgi:hypothetical protein